LTPISKHNRLEHTGVTRLGATTDRATIKGIYLSSTISVTVPTIADAESDNVAVDVSAAFTVQPAVGDAVLAIPSATVTDLLINGAYVTATDQITVSFGTKEGGGGVTTTGVDFKFLLIDLT